MINEILTAFFFFLPAGVANTVPVIVAKLPIIRKYNQPIDMGLKINGIRLLGDHKTIRGLVSGIIGGIATAYIISHYLTIFNSSDEYNWFTLGLALSLGALLGDMAKSFFKRRLNIESGKTWIPFDQIDYITGAILASLFLTKLPIIMYIIAALLYTGLHPLFTICGYLLKLKKDPI